MSSFNLGEWHPAIIHFPIALIFMTLVFDILYGFTKKEIFQVIANWLIVSAAVVIIPTAITGFLAADFSPEESRRLSTSKHGYCCLPLHNWICHF